MSRVFTDQGLLSWEAYVSSGRFGLPDRPRVLFNPLSEPDRRARFVVLDGDEADAEVTLEKMADEELREMLETARELD